MPLHVLSVASEIFPLVKTGGLADVTAALAHALAAEDVQVRTLIPGYPAVLDGVRHGSVVHEFDDLHGGPARLIAATAAGLELLVIDAPHLYARDGNPYVGPDGNDWPDNAVRFGALCRVGSMIGLGLLAGYRPDVVHAHDWQAGLTPVYLHLAGETRPATVITVHNLAFQGQFPPWLRGDLMLPEEAYTVHGVEYYGSIGFLKGALALADRITTVSPTYAAEIRTPEHGMGLDGVLRERFPVLSGILNGVDTCVWNPAKDDALEATYDARRLASRARNKLALQARLGLTQDPDALVFGVIGRLSWQKGVDILLDSLGVIDAHGAQLAVVGSGDHILEHALVDAASHRHGRMAVSIGYSESLAHLVQAGADALIVPSRFEPCGLTQLCALRYGALPIVSRVGGLADTVIDANAAALEAHAGTGFVFAPPARDALNMALERVALLWRDREQWKAVQRRGMATDVSWKRPAAKYAQLYREAIAERHG